MIAVDDPARVAELLERGREGTRSLPGKHGLAPVDYANVVVEIPDAPGALARLFAEAQGLEDYSIEVIDPPSDPAAPPVAPEVDGLASEQPDPEEMRCYQWGDGSGCSTCIMSFFGCSYWASDCLDGAWSNC